MKRYIRCTTSSKKSRENADQIAYELLAAVTRKLRDIMQSPKFGYSAEEAKSYSNVDIHRAGERWCVEVRAEVTYGGFMDILPQLNPIVQEIDPDAYFDMEEPGIATSYVDIKDSIKSSQDLPDYKIEPPEPEYDYTEKDDIDDGILVHVNSDVVVDDREVYFADDEYRWADNPSNASGDWYSVDYPEVRLAYPEDVAEDVLEILTDKLPDVEGTYHVEGYIWLQFYIENVNEWYRIRRSHPDDDDDRFIAWDDVEVRYSKEDSDLDDGFQIKRIK